MYYICIHMYCICICKYIFLYIYTIKPKFWRLFEANNKKSCVSTVAGARKNPETSGGALRADVQAVYTQWVALSIGDAFPRVHLLVRPQVRGLKLSQVFSFNIGNVIICMCLSVPYTISTLESGPRETSINVGVPAPSPGLTHSELCWTASG